MIKQYMKKPVVVEAVQYTGDNGKECEEFIEGNFDNSLYYPNIVTLEGVHKVSVGDFIIKEVKGELSLCKPDIFGMTYTEKK
jgi:hypothetical protein